MSTVVSDAFAASPASRTIFIAFLGSGRFSLLHQLLMLRISKDVKMFTKTKK